MQYISKEKVNKLIYDFVDDDSIIDFLIGIINQNEDDSIEYEDDDCK